MLRLTFIGGRDELARFGRVSTRLRGAVSTIRHVAGTPADIDSFFADGGRGTDAVILGAASGDREQLCRRAASARKHVLTPGPLAGSAVDARALVAACAGVRLMVAGTARFTPALRTIKESLDSRKLGALALVRIHRWRPRSNQATEVWQDLDLACWLFGAQPDFVYAAGNDDCMQIHLGFAGGGMALIDFASSLPPGDSYFSISAIGSSGAAYADDHHDMQLLFAGERPHALRTGQCDLSVLAELQEFVNCVLENREPSVTGADGVRVLEVAEVVAKVQRSGRAIRMGEFEESRR
jgi:predicted dehydrogenase